MKRTIAILSAVLIAAQAAVAVTAWTGAVQVVQIDTNTGQLYPPKAAAVIPTNSASTPSSYLLRVTGDSATNGPLAWPSACGTGLVPAVVGLSNNIASNYYGNIERYDSTSVWWSVRDAQWACITTGIPRVGIALWPASSVFTTNWTAYVAPNTNYWTDPWYSSFARLYFDAYTNSSGVFLDSSPYAHTGSNMPSVLAGPAQVMTLTNQYGRYQPYITTTAGAGQYVKFNATTSLVPTNAVGQVPFTWIAWISNSVAWTNTNVGVLGMDKGASPSRCWRLVVQNGTPRFQVGSSNYSAYIECSGASWSGLSNQWYAVAGTHNGSTGTTAGICLYVCTNFPTVVSNSTRTGSGTFLGMNALPMPALAIAGQDGGANSRGDAFATFAYYLGTNLVLSELSTVITNTYPPNNLVNKSWIPAGQ